MLKIKLLNIHIDVRISYAVSSHSLNIISSHLFPSLPQGTRAQEAWRHRPRVWRSLDLLEWEKADIGGRMGRLGTWYFDDQNVANYGRVLSDKLKPSVEITKGRDRKGEERSLHGMDRMK
jgi:hypothetical protein